MKLLVDKMPIVEYECVFAEWDYDNSEYTCTLRRGEKCDLRIVSSKHFTVNVCSRLKEVTY
jgi:hypothetical protein